MGVQSSWQPCCGVVGKGGKAVMVLGGGYGGWGCGGGSDGDNGSWDVSLRATFIVVVVKGMKLLW